MDLICKIEGRGAFRQAYKGPFGRKNHYLGRKQVHLEFIEKFNWILKRIFEHHPYLLDPFIKLSLGRVVSLVLVMCCISPFSDLIHSSATDLNLNPVSIRTHYCQMKGFIAVWLWPAYPVAQPVGFWKV